MFLCIHRAETFMLLPGWVRLKRGQDIPDGCFIAVIHFSEYSEI